MEKSINLKTIGLILAIGIMLYFVWLFIRKAGNIAQAVNNLLTSPAELISTVWGTFSDEVSSFWNYLTNAVNIGSPNAVTQSTPSTDANNPTPNLTYNAGNIGVGNGTNIQIDPNSPLGQAYLGNNWDSFYLDSNGVIKYY